MPSRTTLSRPVQTGRRSPVAASLLACLILGAPLAASGCGSGKEKVEATAQAKKDLPPVPVPMPKKDQPVPVPVPKKEQPVPVPGAKTLAELADKVAVDAGKRGTLVEGKAPRLLVFGESHISRKGQLEIALMLYRLYRDYGLRDIALEGYVTGTKADATWFHKLPANPADQKRLATRLLAEGEISCAEYMALLFPDLTLHPIESPDLYKTKIEDDAAGAGLVYVFEIVKKRLQDPQVVREHGEKIRALKGKEQLEYLLEKVDPWVAEKSQLLRGKKAVPQAEEWLAALQEIEKKAEQVGVQLPEKAPEQMRRLKGFWEAVDKRSGFMVNETVGVLGRSRERPVAMIIGAAHRDGVLRRVGENKQPYALIDPLALAETDKVGEMTFDAFRRKGTKLSVDDTGLGRFLDDRKPADDKKPTGGMKPEPVISEPWLQAKADLYLLSAKIARRAAKAPAPRKPPFDLAAVDLRLPYVTIDPKTIRLDGDEVVFAAVVYPDDATRQRTIWTRVAYVGKVAEVADDTDVEILLKAELKKIGGGNEAPPGVRADANAKDDPKVTTPVVAPADDVISKFSQQEGGVAGKIGS